MKRPKAIFFIIALCLFAAAPNLRFFLRIAETFQTAGEQPPAWIALVQPATFVLLLWLLAGLSQLRPRACWIAVGVFGVDLIGRAFFFKFLTQGTGAKPSAVVCFMALELAAIWYLSRPSFRELARKYSAERDQEDSRKRMQKMSLKKISKGLWN